MPLQLDRNSLNPYAATPRYQQLADRIAAAINTGELEPGELLPSEDKLYSMVGLSRTTVRKALDRLVADGLVDRRSGVGTRVLERPPIRHMNANRYAEELRILAAGGEHPQVSAFTVDHEIDWADYSVDVEYNREQATVTDGERLHVKVGSPILRRIFVKRIDGVPVQLQRSALPYKLVSGTPVADPERQPWPGGTLAELYSLGLVVTKVTEDVWARPATTEERVQLEMTTPAPVWDLVRVFWVGDQAVEASRVIAPTARLILSYETDLDTSAAGASRKARD